MFDLKRALLVFILTVSVVLPAVGAELATRKNSDRGVTVAVTPQNVSADAKTWDFKIVLDTHSQDLSDDLLKSVVLIDQTGTRHVPAAWEGAVPGGHHREGVLRFRAISPQPSAMELQITRPGEAAPRSFKWELN